MTGILNNAKLLDEALDAVFEPERHRCAVRPGIELHSPIKIGGEPLTINEIESAIDEGRD